MNLQKTYDFREYLKKELQARVARNPAYSLRAFSRSLAVDSSRLAKILSGKRPINADLIETLGVKLGLDEKKIREFKSGTQKPYQKISKKQNIEILDSCYQLKMDQLALISDWQHYAILELMKHPQFEPSTDWIAKQLHQPLPVISKAIERLQRVGLVVVEKNGRWRDASQGFSTHVLGENLTSNAHRNYQSQILDLSKAALFKVPIELRDHSTIAVASNPQKIQMAKKMLKQMRRELAEFLEDTEDKIEVYHLNFGLFPTVYNTDKDIEVPL